MKRENLSGIQKEQEICQTFEKLAAAADALYEEMSGSVRTDLSSGARALSQALSLNGLDENGGFGGKSK